MRFFSWSFPLFCLFFLFTIDYCGGGGSVTWLAELYLLIVQWQRGRGFFYFLFYFLVFCCFISLLESYIIPNAEEEIHMLVLCSVRFGPCPCHSHVGDCYCMRQLDMFSARSTSIIPDSLFIHQTQTFISMAEITWTSSHGVWIL